MTSRGRRRRSHVQRLTRAINAARSSSADDGRPQRPRLDVGPLWLLNTRSVSPDCVWARRSSPPPWRRRSARLPRPPTSGPDGGTAVRLARGSAPNLGAIRVSGPALVTPAPTSLTPVQQGERPRGRACGPCRAPRPPRRRPDPRHGPLDAARPRTQIAATPQAVWLGRWRSAPAVTTTIGRVLAPALSRGCSTFVLYAIPHRDCHAGGLTMAPATGAADPRRRCCTWPASPQSSSSNPTPSPCRGLPHRPGQQERTDLLRYAVGRLATGSTCGSTSTRGTRNWDVAARRRRGG